ncbi:MAG: hypothetical protein ABI317_16545 [Gaiellales bacterium]
MIPTPSLAVTLSSHAAGARPVAVAIVMHYEMQCNWPGPGVLAIRFPGSMVLPRRLASSAVLVDKRAASGAVTVAGRTVSVPLPQRPRIMCDLMGPGTLTVSFSRAAKLGNPKAAGSYSVLATHGSDSGTGRVVIRS